MFCYSHLAKCRRRSERAIEGSAVSNASAVFSSTTTESPHEFFGYTGPPSRGIDIIVAFVSGSLLHVAPVRRVLFQRVVQSTIVSGELLFTTPVMPMALRFGQMKESAGLDHYLANRSPGKSGRHF